MKLFLDSADIRQVRKWLPVIDGLTTNPVILEKDGGDVAEIAGLLGSRPISIEVGNDMEKDALYWKDALPNAVIKIPLLNPDGGNNLALISELSLHRGVKVNCTALFSLSQVILAVKAGSYYVSLFAGRVDDEGGDYRGMIADAARFLGNSFTVAELIVGSIRTVGNVLDAVRAGADIVTVPPGILDKMALHQNSIRTSREFEDAYTRLSK